MQSETPRRRATGRPFVKGQTGNPRGRPPKSKNTDALFAAELNQRIKVSEGGKTVRMTKREAMVKRAVAGALAGEHKDIAIVLAHDARAREMLGIAADTLSGEKHEFVKEALVERLRAQFGLGGEQAGDTASSANGLGSFADGPGNAGERAPGSRPIGPGSPA